MFSAILRGVSSATAHIPWLKDLSLNFILIHYIYIISMAILSSIILYPGMNLKYIDALFLSAGAASQSGLNTVDLNLLFTYQQVVLYFVSMLTTPIFIHTALVFVRLYWFEKRFQHVVRDARALRSTRSRMRTMSHDKNAQTHSGEESGINGRPIVVLRNNPGNATAGDAQEGSSGLTDSTESGSVSPTSGGSISKQQPEEPPHDATGGLQHTLGSLRVPAPLGPEHHIAFLENQRKGTPSALRIPSPREYDRGGVPQLLEEAEGSRTNRRTSYQSDAPRSPRSVDEDNAPPMEGPHITINEPDFPWGRTRNLTFPRLDTRPTVRETKDGREPSILNRIHTRRPTFTSIYRSLTQERDRPTLPYLSWDATVGRNSNFIDLTEEQRDELGGIEYRALKTLAVVLISYYVFFHLLGVICLLPWIMETRWGQVVTAAGQGRPWWAFFTAASAFNDVGFTLTPDSMMSFQDAIFALLFLAFLIIIGNTGFPCMLRLIIWTLSKIASKETPLWEELNFLLDHPRRCFTLLFPRNATWWLFAILILLNGIDLIFFIILDLNDPTVTTLPTGIKIVDGLFQATCTRTAGFSVVNTADLHPAVQVSYMIMMYISVFPIAISMRRTNVYEEKSLGVYPNADDEFNEDAQTAPSYIGFHLRRQLSFDLWYVFLGLFIISIVEGDRIENASQYSFQIWTVLFEVVSAYGTVGLSLGYPGVNASFSSQFRVISVLVIIAMQIRGRHRGLPYSLDRAILLPSESLNQNEIVDAERRMRRRTSNLSQMGGTVGRRQSQASENAVSTGFDANPWPSVPGDPITHRHLTIQSQRSHR
ncbi:hypothetical protein P175DRAFT_0516729 [Aspergillus ochraceoroseus IBT 24754]|uniref:Potassium transport protein n=3 Tax=Aspergillus subgen. Nidulantes TaxID=2720870 RepID=A0A0F8WRR3_9EURO|nr:uncharacterized protein P175DRAFT_0516729 [Aspergillus ochraceoroseus IBT 24754]KKK13942.1 hypothetical protein ARAM_005609 [Aspergillus rambellii]KKK19226.1 hypothetical protein AOCH_006580 [Aspergillus ochraceoroseus]PTU21161.1 hypothetical protein P175DRAFT_0516729 [Aspergillus ochraceoroseus IBT 24754]